MVRIPSLNEPNSARPGSGWDGVDYLDSVKKATDDYDAAAPIRAEIAELKKKNEDFLKELDKDGLNRKDYIICKRTMTVEVAHV